MLKLLIASVIIMGGTVITYPAHAKTTTVSTYSQGIYQYQMQASNFMIKSDQAALSMVTMTSFSQCNVQIISRTCNGTAMVIAPDGTRYPAEVECKVADKGFGVMFRAPGLVQNGIVAGEGYILPAGYTLMFSLSRTGEVRTTRTLYDECEASSLGLWLHQYHLPSPSVTLTSSSGARYTLGNGVMSTSFPAGGTTKSITVEHPDSINSKAVVNGAFEQVILKASGTPGASIRVTQSITPSEVARNAQLLKTTGGQCTTMRAGDECKLVLAPGTIRPGQTSSGTVLISVQLQ
ncbi:MULTISPECIES: hypothetical protein [Salmonella]|uniref:Outer membrane protein n=2 Tax=Salmonella enterica TaxID=28901 RepID=A0A761CM07_SALER|nr:hypothetical protein [Salmonella enterica]MZI59140.1 hypothetical protein [Salmonella sp. XN2]HAE8733919.1 hypothetical protein [Salmonella enterica subsp. enterica serovar Abortusequi]HAF8570520.1 hypothetical protein [Salmonella enterica]HAF8627358.1 hypothetical protein [Salmonella enterica]HAF9659475.1 hypothetical protein [Salmonella enterica]